MTCRDQRIYVRSRVTAPCRYGCINVRAGKRCGITENVCLDQSRPGTYRRVQVGGHQRLYYRSVGQDILKLARSSGSHKAGNTQCLTNLLLLCASPVCRTC